MKKAIIIGASSGIGRALALILAQKGYELGIAARRVDLLKSLQAEVPVPVVVKPMDIANPERTMVQMESLIEELGGADLIVLSSGTGFLNPELDWRLEQNTVDVNVTGAVAVMNVASRHFLRQRHGHLVGISSVAALMGGEDAPAYNASKAFLSNYLAGLRRHFKRQGLPIIVTDVRPGFVDTPMAQGEGLFWVASPEKAAAQIYTAIRKKKSVVYVTRRWRLVAWVMRWL